jgi:hypothetical protein
VLGNVDVIKILWTPLLTLIKSFLGGEVIAGFIEKEIDGVQQKIKDLAGTQGKAFSLGVSIATKNTQSKFSWN